MAKATTETKIIKPAVPAVTEQVIRLDLSIEEAERLLFVAGQFTGQLSSVYLELLGQIKSERLLCLGYSIVDAAADEGVEINALSMQDKQGRRVPML